MIMMFIIDTVSAQRCRDYTNSVHDLGWKVEKASGEMFECSAKGWVPGQCDIESGIVSSLTSL